MSKKKDSGGFWRVIVILLRDIAIAILLFTLGLHATMLFLLSNANHGYTLNAVMENIRNEKYEYAATFVGPIKILERTSFAEDYTDGGFRYKVRLKGVTESFDIIEWLTVDEIIHLHNHPGDDNASFSLNDLRVASGQNVDVMIVVTRDYTYTLQAPGGWPSAEELDRMEDELDMQKMCDDGLLAAYDYEMIDESTMRVVSWIATPKFTQWLADRYDLIYTVEPVDP